MAHPLNERRAKAAQSLESSDFFYYLNFDRKEFLLSAFLKKGKGRLTIQAQKRCQKGEREKCQFFRAKNASFRCPPLKSWAYMAQSQQNEQCRVHKAIEGTRTTSQGFPFSIIQ